MAAPAYTHTDTDWDALPEQDQANTCYRCSRMVTIKKRPWYRQTGGGDDGSGPSSWSKPYCRQTVPKMRRIIGAMGCQDLISDANKQTIGG